MARIAVLLEGVAFSFWDFGVLSECSNPALSPLIGVSCKDPGFERLDPDSNSVFERFLACEDFGPGASGGLDRDSAAGSLTAERRVKCDLQDSAAASFARVSIAS